MKTKPKKKESPSSGPGQGSTPEEQGKKPAAAKANLRVLAPLVVPWRWGAVTAAIAVVQYPVTWLVDAPVWVTAPLILATGWATAALLRRRLRSDAGAARRPLSAGWVATDPGHAKVCGWVATVWVTLVHIVHPTSWSAVWIVITVGLVALVACAARFWRHHRASLPTDTTTETPTVVDSGPPPPEGEHPMARTWRRMVGSNGCALPGSRLTDIVEEPYGIHATLKLVKGRQTLTMARSALDQIASGMGIDANSILLERVEATKEHPTPDPARPTVRLITASVVNEAIPLTAAPGYWKGSTYRIPLGPFVDGDGTAEWRLYSADSMWGGFLAGATGGGKSAILDIIASGAWESGCTAVIFIDPKSGGSSPRIARNATWFLPNAPRTWDRVLDGLVSLVRARGAENAEMGTSGFTPSRERPGVLVIIDEAHDVITKQTADRWATVAREGRAAGVAMLAASQIYGLETFGGSDAIRESLVAGNTVALRVGANQSSMIRDLPLKPWTLPKIPGMGLIDKGRAAMFRACYAPPADKIDGEEWPLDTVSMDTIIDTAASKAPELDDLAAGAIDVGTEIPPNDKGEGGDDGIFLCRHELQAEAAQVRSADLEALRAHARNGGSRDTDFAEDEPEFDHVTPSTVAPTGGTDDVDPAALPVVDLSVIRARGTDVAHRVDKAVLDALAEGEAKRSTVERLVREATGAGRSSVQRALDRLQERGLVASSEWGTWRRTDDGG